ncbi:DUF4056 domain-containing protein [Maribacter sp. R77961]|uniref:DUF4056 domain-containing protein n=1 Tax=Maribacter sp. R77961 TaxID=3093871 RepID=UPI0037CBFCB6
MKPYFHKIVITSLKLVLLLGFILKPSVVSSQKADSPVNLNKIPPRIIRACCAFGYDLKLWGVPFVNIDQVISITDLEGHHYMGNKSEGTGTVYTRRGGFIDIGHLRDQIDWTRYLYTLIMDSKGKGDVVLSLRNEAGRKKLHLNIPKTLDENDCILLAGKIAYDFSLWHEISTWYGASTLPFMPEKFSSFSVEDVYSNLLGIHVGMKTLRTKLPFNAAATKFIASTLDSLNVVKTTQETYDAYNAVHNKWYTNEKRIPHINITLKRDLDVLKYSRPWIVPDIASTADDPVTLDVPQVDSKENLLTSYYQFTIDANRRIPVETLFPNRQSNRISQNDFKILLNAITKDLQRMGEILKSEKE